MSKELSERGWPQEKVDFFEKHNIRPVRPMRVPRKLIEKKVKFYEKYGIAYWFENTNERETIYAAGTWGTHMNKESSFKASELQFIKEVKEHIIKNETYKLVKNKFTTDKKIDSIKYSIFKNIKPGTVYKNCIEIDLKGAYWEQLNMLPGLINEKIYAKGLTVEKRTRLACVGTLNKTTGCIAFDGKQSTVLEDIKSDKTGFLWHTISHKIGQVLSKASKIVKRDFIFAWVDALFIHGDKKDEILKLFKDAGFNASVYKCESISFGERKIIVTSKDKGKWVTKTTREKITLPNGKKAIKLIKRRVYTEDRPFPYKKVLSKKEIDQLNANKKDEKN